MDVASLMPPRTRESQGSALVVSRLSIRIRAFRIANSGHFRGERLHRHRLHRRSSPTAPPAVHEHQALSTLDSAKTYAVLNADDYLRGSVKPTNIQQNRDARESTSVMRVLRFATTAFAHEHTALNGIRTMVPAQSDFAGQPVIQTGTVRVNDWDVKEPAKLSSTPTTDSENNATIHTGKEYRWASCRARPALLSLCVLVFSLPSDKG